MHTIQDLPRKTRPRLLTEEMLSAMDQILREDDEATARRLRATLCEKFPSSPEVSLATIKRLVNHTFCILSYMLFMQRCQKMGVYMTPLLPIHQEVNKIKRKDWCQRQLENKEQFENVIFTGMCKQ